MGVRLTRTYMPPFSVLVSVMTNLGKGHLLQQVRGPVMDLEKREDIMSTTLVDPRLKGLVRAELHLSLRPRSEWQPRSGRPFRSLFRSLR
jgi:hypothetical protein